MSTFRQMTCLLLCLVQWLETQPADSARQAFAKTLRNFGNTRTQEPNDRYFLKLYIVYFYFYLSWLYTLFVVKKSSKQMAECRHKREHPYTWVISFVNHQLPNIYQCQNEASFIQRFFEYYKYLGSRSSNVKKSICVFNSTKLG